ncbi:unnamed protein product [Amoebophrya sp. A120]|nr:unnamed protein product [Amoebophrya sp. A120]|eukprot:GSA120T00014070001.1
MGTSANKSRASSLWAICESPPCTKVLLPCGPGTRTTSTMVALLFLTLAQVEVAPATAITTNLQNRISLRSRSSHTTLSSLERKSSSSSRNAKQIANLVSVLDRMQSDLQKELELEAQEAKKKQCYCENTIDETKKEVSVGKNRVKEIGSALKQQVGVVAEEKVVIKELKAKLEKQKAAVLAATEIFEKNAKTFEDEIKEANIGKRDIESALVVLQKPGMEVKDVQLVQAAVAALVQNSKEKDVWFGRDRDVFGDSFIEGATDIAGDSYNSPEHQAEPDLEGSGAESLSDQHVGENEMKEHLQPTSTRTSFLQVKSEMNEFSKTRTSSTAGTSFASQLAQSLDDDGGANAGATLSPTLARQIIANFLTKTTATAGSSDPQSESNNPVILMKKSLRSLRSSDDHQDHVDLALLQLEGRQGLSSSTSAKNLMNTPSSPALSRLLGMLKNMKNNFEKTATSLAEKQKKEKTEYDEFRSTTEGEVNNLQQRLDDKVKKQNAAKLQIEDLKEERGKLVEKELPEAERFLVDTVQECDEAKKEFAINEKARLDELKGLAEGGAVLKEFLKEGGATTSVAAGLVQVENPVEQESAASSILQQDERSSSRFEVVHSDITPGAGPQQVFLQLGSTTRTSSVERDEPQLQPGTTPGVDDVDLLAVFNAETHSGKSILATSASSAVLPSARTTTSPTSAFFAEDTLSDEARKARGTKERGTMPRRTSTPAKAFLLQKFNDLFATAAGEVEVRAEQPATTRKTGSLPRGEVEQSSTSSSSSSTAHVQQLAQEQTGRASTSMVQEQLQNNYNKLKGDVLAQDEKSSSQSGLQLHQQQMYTTHKNASFSNTLVEKIQKLITHLKTKQAADNAARDSCSQDLRTNAGKLDLLKRKEQEVTAGLEKLQLQLEQIGEKVENVEKHDLPKIQGEQKQLSQERERENKLFQDEVKEQRAMKKVLELALKQISKTSVGSSSKTGGGTSSVEKLFHQLITEAVEEEKQLMTSEATKQREYISLAQEFTQLEETLVEKRDNLEKQRAQLQEENFKVQNVEKKQILLEIENHAKVSRERAAECDFILKAFGKRQADRTAEKEKLAKAQEVLKGLDK